MKGSMCISLFMSLALVAFSPTVASAATGSGQSYLYKGPSGSWGYAEWYGSSNGLRLIANPSSMATGYCLDAWFDWNREGTGHFDARVARSCRGLYQRDSGFNYESTDVAGMQKWAVCYGLNNQTTSPTSNCNQHPEHTSDISGVNPNLPNSCTRSWRLTSSGSYLYDGGGSSTSCSS